MVDMGMEYIKLAMKEAGVEPEEMYLTIEWYVDGVMLKVAWRSELENFPKCDNRKEYKQTDWRANADRSWITKSIKDYVTKHPRNQDKVVR